MRIWKSRERRIQLRMVRRGLAVDLLRLVREEKLDGEVQAAVARRVLRRWQGLDSEALGLLLARHDVDGEVVRLAADCRRLAVLEMVFPRLESDPQYSELARVAMKYCVKQPQVVHTQLFGVLAAGGFAAELSRYGDFEVRYRVAAARGDLREQLLALREVLGLGFLSGSMSYAMGYALGRRPTNLGGLSGENRLGAGSMSGLVMLGVMRQRINRASLTEWVDLTVFGGWMYQLIEPLLEVIEGGEVGEISKKWAEEAERIDMILDEAPNWGDAEFKKRVLAQLRSGELRDEAVQACAGRAAAFELFRQEHQRQPFSKLGLLGLAGRRDAPDWVVLAALG